MEGVPPVTCIGSLADQLNKRVIVVLKDGRHIVGIMRNFDQYSNITIEDAYERRYADNYYGDSPAGIYILRGENIVLVGELDEEIETHHPVLTRLTGNSILDYQANMCAPDYPVGWKIEDD